MPKQDTVRFTRGNSDDWARINPILKDGEPGKETDTGRFKMGNGRTHWVDLPYYLPEPDIRQAIQDAIDALPPTQGGGGGEVTLSMLTAHVNSLTPHTVYDNGPDLKLLYLNAKV